MKPTTDPETGKTTCVLETKDRNKLAAAKTVVEELAVVRRSEPDASLLGDLADALGAVIPTGSLMSRRPRPKQPDETVSTPTAK